MKRTKKRIAGTPANGRAEPSLARFDSRHAPLDARAGKGGRLTAGKGFKGGQETEERNGNHWGSASPCRTRPPGRPGIGVGKSLGAVPSASNSCLGRWFLLLLARFILVGGVCLEVKWGLPQWVHMCLLGGDGGGGLGGPGGDGGAPDIGRRMYDDARKEELRCFSPCRARGYAGAGAGAAREGVRICQLQGHPVIPEISLF